MHSSSEIVEKIQAKDLRIDKLRESLASLVFKARADGVLPPTVTITEFTDIRDISATPHFRKLKICQQKINHTTNQRKRLMADARKSDTREKIQLGGLVVKAGLRDTNKALILGALLDIAHSIESGDEKKIQTLTTIGKNALTSDPD